ncbi:MAG: multicopper oxidase domain-containing protein [Janthinobacterium lividum]
MHTRHRLMTGAALAALATSSLLAPSRAAELLPPIPLATGGLAANPSPPGSGCTPAAEGHVDEFLAVVRSSPRPDVGPYTVTLPGYSSNPGSAAGDSYRPFLIQASPGDTIRFDLVNQLTAADTINNDPLISAAESVEANVHFHGLIVSPHSNNPAATPCALPGDYVFAQTDPGATTSYRVDIPATLPGRLLGATNSPTPYPSGLTWFHAHIHGKTMDDIASGQAGLVSIGDTVGSLLAAPGIPAADQAALKATTTQYLALRDIQLAAPPASDPATALPGTPATWLRGATSEYDFQACREGSFPAPAVAGTTNVSHGNGWCGHSGLRYINSSANTTHNVGGMSPDTRWLFTVNGQVFPSITIAPGTNNLWRVANLSDTQTYVLQLTEDSTGQQQPMQVVTIDGVVTGTSGDPGSPNKQLGVNLRQILMLPATRAEIFIPNSATTADRVFTLSTAGASTGVNTSANPSFDDYQGINSPAVNLAQVVMKAGQASATQPLSLTLAGAAASTQANTRGLAATSTAAFAAPPANCIALPQYGGTSYGFRRRINFAIGNNLSLGSEVVNAATGKNIDTSLDGNGAGAHTIPQSFFSMADMTNPAADRRICPRLGEQEVWELVNYSNEMHNFHIHQVKFRLSVPGDRGVPPGYTAAQSITDPNNMVAALAPEVAGQSPVANVDLWHDTLPVPPASTNGVPGRVFVTIPFRAQQQVGSFVYHCHFLYHEDLGMMALVQVYDPLAPTRVTENAVDDAIRASMCTAPGSAALPTPTDTILQRLRTLTASPT